MKTIGIIGHGKIGSSIIKKVMESELKLVEEVCEWEYRDRLDEYKIDCLTGYVANQHYDIERYTACPYCGKPIKVKGE